MKKIFKKSLILCMALAITLTGMSAFAFAATEGPDTTGGSARFEVTGYTITNLNGKDINNTSRIYTITKGDVVNIEVTIKYNSAAANPGDTLDVSRRVDSFSGGKAVITKISDKQGTYKITATGLKYKGVDQKLVLMVRNGDKYDDIEVPFLKQRFTQNRTIHRPSHPHRIQPGTESNHQQKSAFS